VEAYESAQWDYSDVPYSSIKSLSSTFSESMPTGSLTKNGVDAGAAYDMFLNGSDTDEVMAAKNETSGTVNYYAVLSWLHRHGMLASSDTLSQFNFGWEICDTGGKARTFTVHSLTLHQEL
jgi:hypothetical protein